MHFVGRLLEDAAAAVLTSTVPGPSFQNSTVWTAFGTLLSRYSNHRVELCCCSVTAMATERKKRLTSSSSTQMTG